MEITDEQNLPTINGKISWERLHLYRLCVDFASDKTVLDIASGEGYGAAFLAKVAKYVVGVDISQEVIEYASNAYKDFRNLDFIVGSCDSIPLPDNSVDVVTSFKTIEDRDKHENMMQEVKRVLKPGGILIISSPNSATYSDEPNYSNPFYVKGLDFEEFNALLNKYFRYSKIYGQRLAIGSFIYPLDNPESKILTAYIGESEDLEQKVCSLDSPMYFVAICSDKATCVDLALDSVYSELALEQASPYLLDIQSELRRAQMTIAAMETSKFWKMRSVWFSLRKKIGLSDDRIPIIRSLFSIIKNRGSNLEPNKFGLEKLLQGCVLLPGIPLSENFKYQKWLNRNYPTQATLQKMREQSNFLNFKPLISIVIPVFNPPINFLKEAIDSVLDQVYPYWELCIADDASPNEQVRATLEEYAAKDERIKVIFRNTNGHISHCSNSALELATGEFVSLLDHDDLLTPDALYEVALLLNKHPDADMIYSDEDKITEEGKLQDPFFKPDWCPDSLLSRMYTCHLGTYRRELLEEIGGFRVGYEGSQDYDLVLRLTEKTTKVFHISKILYHWRIHSQSAASQPHQKPYAAVAAQKALTDALARRGESGKVTQAASLAKHYIIRYDIQDYKLVSIIIPTKDLAHTLDTCLQSIFQKTIYPNYEVILIDNGSKEKDTFSIIDKWNQRESERFHCYSLDIPFNYSKINNWAVERAKGDYLLFLNNDVEVITPDWIDAMVEQAQRPSIGAVGALLLYPDNTIQHAGVVLGVGGVAGHSHKYFPRNSPGYFDQVATVNNYSAVTAACLMCRKAVFQNVRGFEEELAVAFNDVDFCLKLVEGGYRNIYLPHVVLYHYESKSRGNENNPEKQARFLQEIEYMQKKWANILTKDPCYSRNLTLIREDFSLNV